ncbi:uncharacterized protein K02A2.6-like [Manduca sexta]|uniref:uncharacterized protein K02A2.6-like n=1 Tax=Manduca sexta TaxID=7130 RepID=UPI00188F27CB|nr:uncharacterized protein K02A2.6-like [Manduca sexta]
MRHADALSRNPYVGTITSNLHKDMQHAQDGDEGLNAIKKILEDGGSYKDYYLNQGLLYKGPEHQLVVPSAMETEIIKRAHNNGHFAKKKTLDLISKDYYIDKVGRKVEDFVASCIPCLLSNRKEGKKEGYLNPIDKGDTPLHTLHLDHVGPLTETNKQYNHILTIIDAFTKFVWLFPCKSTTTKEVLIKLEVLQQTFGNPERVITDRGTAFTSNDFQQYCIREGIECCHITTGVPRGNTPYIFYNKNCRKYKEGDIVAIKRTQFGPGMKIKPKYLGPYRITKVKRFDRYDVEKVDQSTEGPNKTSTAADLMKQWPDNINQK